MKKRLALCMVLLVCFGFAFMQTIAVKGTVGNSRGQLTKYLPKPIIHLRTNLIGGTNLPAPDCPIPTNGFIKQAATAGAIMSCNFIRLPKMRLSKTEF